MNLLDLFSGIGGFSLGLERAGFKTVAFCEIEPFCRQVLKKHWPEVPIYEDVRELTAARLESDGIAVDAICGGFPCQPFSAAGKKMGVDDNRHLWPEYFRLIKELRPSWVIGENVIGIVGMALDSVLDDLEGLGYSTRTFDIPACAVGARHERRRVWIVAYAERQRLQGQGEFIDALNSEAHPYWEADRIVSHVQGASLPYVCGKHDGLPARLVESGLKGLGNAVVPQIPELIGRAIMRAAA